MVGLVAVERFLDRHDQTTLFLQWFFYTVCLSLCACVRACVVRPSVRACVRVRVCAKEEKRGRGNGNEIGPVHLLCIGSPPAIFVFSSVIFSYENTWPAMSFLRILASLLC